MFSKEELDIIHYEWYKVFFDLNMFKMSKSHIDLISKIMKKKDSVCPGCKGLGYVHNHILGLIKCTYCDLFLTR